MNVKVRHKKEVHSENHHDHKSEIANIHPLCEPRPDKLKKDS